tara:strand:- start:855 stop:1121 length:267 start_codon:yes stop_codon:yes gene_type:complete
MTTILKFTPCDRIVEPLIEYEEEEQDDEFDPTDRCEVCNITQSDCLVKFDGVFDLDCGLTDSKMRLESGDWGKWGAMCPDCIWDADNP